jgi:uncharacterized membrane protein (UPF0127 family)
MKMLGKREAGGLKMTKFSFNYKGKRFNLDVLECKTVFQKMHGLMFRKRSKPLLFIFDKKTLEPIHSFFCMPFIAIWIDSDKIIDIKFVRPWRIYVKPSKKFDKLLEIPVGNKEFQLFLDEKKDLNT